jgi:hypothetical protein
MTLNFIMSFSFAFGVLVVGPPEICERLDALPDGIELLGRVGPDAQPPPSAANASAEIAQQARIW